VGPREVVVGTPKSVDRAVDRIVVGVMVILIIAVADVETLLDGNGPIYPPTGRPEGVTLELILPAVNLKASRVRFDYHELGE
jgi:hypothetical protein